MPPRVSYIDVWWVTPGSDGHLPVGDLLNDLDEVERGRARAYRSSADRDRFLVGAALVRRLAAPLGGTSAAQVVVDRSCEVCGAPHGRVRLPGIAAAVSVSHAGAYVGVAIATGDVSIGLDIETGKVGADLRDLVLATDEESDDLRSTWVRKEAALKALGVGLRRPMSTLTIAALGAGGWTVRGVGTGDLAGRDLTGPDGRDASRAALAVSGPAGGWEVREQDAEALLRTR